MAALATALTGCGEGDPSGEAADPVSEERARPKSAISLSAEEIRTALPNDTTLGGVFTGGEPVAGEGEEARGQCAEETGTECGGLVAAGRKELAAGSDADEERIQFALFSFASRGEAGSAMKGLVSQRREADSGSGDPARPVTLATGADTADAFADDSRTDVLMRVGDVVVHVWATESGVDEVEYAARTQVDRIRTVAAGGVPNT